MSTKMEKGKKTAMVYGDSMPLPRRIDGLGWTSTWTYHLEQLLQNHEYASVILRSKGFATSKDVVKQIRDELEYFVPDLFILNVGIVDLSPRALRKHERLLVGATRLIHPSVFKFVRGFLSKNHAKIASFRNICYVKPKQFSKSVNRIIELIAAKGQTPLLICGVFPAGALLREKAPGIEKKIKEYNTLLKEAASSSPQTHFVNFGDCESLVDEYLLSDGMHLNKKGHELVANRIYNAVCGLPN